jgi:hypothetical protein
MCVERTLQLQNSQTKSNSAAAENDQELYFPILTKNCSSL